MKGKIFNTFFVKFSSAAFNFLTVIMLSQILGAKGRGEASIILTTISIVVIFSGFSGGGSLVYLIPRNNIKSILVTCYAWFLGISIIAYFLIQYIFPSQEDYALHIVIISLLSSVTGANSSFLIAKERLEKSNLIQFLQAVIIFVGLLILFYFLKNKTIDAYIFSLYLSSSLICFLSFIFILGDVQKEKTSEFRFLFKETLRYGIMNQMAHITQFLSFRASYYIIEKFWGDSTVGVYSNGVSIAESIWIVSRSIALVQISKITNTDNEKYSRYLTIKLTKITVLITSVLLIGLLVLPSSFYMLIFGSEFSELPFVIMTLAPGIIFFAIALVVGYYFSGTGKYEINAIASGAGLIITLGMGFVLIPLSPILGAGITASFSYFVTALIVLLIFFKNGKNSWHQLIPQRSDWRIFQNYLRIKNKRSR